MSFRGFPESGLAFLQELARNNHRDWFEQHRAPWDELIVPAMLELLQDLHGRLSDVMPKLVLQARQGGSLYRLARDTRFGKDKRPFNACAAGLLWEGDERQDAPAIYLRIAPDEVLFGGGIFLFEEARVERYRKLLQNVESAGRLESALNSGTEAGLTLEGEQLARPPRPFNGEHPRAELSRYKGLTLSRHEKPGAWLHTADALDRLEQLARAYAPLHAWMRDELY